MEAVLESLKVIIDYISMTFSSVISLITMIPELYASIYSSFAYAPSFVAPFLTLSGYITMLFAVIRLVK